MTAVMAEERSTGFAYRRPSRMSASGPPTRSRCRPLRTSSACSFRLPSTRTPADSPARRSYSSGRRTVCCRRRGQETDSTFQTTRCGISSSRAR